jgi:hypothetical protein
MQIFRSRGVVLESEVEFWLRSTRYDYFLFISSDTTDPNPSFVYSACYHPLLCCFSYLTPARQNKLGYSLLQHFVSSYQYSFCFDFKCHQATLHIFVSHTSFTTNHSPSHFDCARLSTTRVVLASSPPFFSVVTPKYGPDTLYFVV